MQVYILTENGPQKMKWSRKSNMNPSQNRDIWNTVDLGENCVTTKAAVNVSLLRSCSQALFTCVYALSHVQSFVTPLTVAHQAPLSMGFPRQEYWSGLPFPPPGDLPDPGIGPTLPASPALQAASTH